MKRKTGRISRKKRVVGGDVGEWKDEGVSEAKNHIWSYKVDAENEIFAIYNGIDKPHVKLPPDEKWTKENDLYVINDESNEPEIISNKLPKLLSLPTCNNAEIQTICKIPPPPPRQNGGMRKKRRSIKKRRSTKRRTA